MVSVECRVVGLWGDTFSGQGDGVGRQVRRFDQLAATPFNREDDEASSVRSARMSYGESRQMLPVRYKEPLGHARQRRRRGLRPDESAQGCRRRPQLVWAKKLGHAGGVRALGAARESGSGSGRWRMAGAAVEF